MFYIFDNFDYTAVASGLNTLSKNQESLVKFIKKFDEEMRIGKEEREATQDGGEEQF